MRERLASRTVQGALSCSVSEDFITSLVYPNSARQKSLTEHVPCAVLEAYLPPHRSFLIRVR